MYIITTLPLKATLKVGYFYSIYMISKTIIISYLYVCMHACVKLLKCLYKQGKMLKISCENMFHNCCVNLIQVLIRLLLAIQM